MLSFENYKRKYQAGEIDNEHFFATVAKHDYKQRMLSVIPAKLDVYPFYIQHNLPHARLLYHRSIRQPKPLFLPARFALKAVNGEACFGTFLICDGVDLRSGHAYPTFDSIRERYINWKGFKELSDDYVAEELILSLAGNLPPDFRVHCFGKTKKVITNWRQHKSGHRVYDENWKLLFNNSEFNDPPKQAMQDVLELAERTRAILDVPFVRIDLLWTLNRGALLGELSRQPGNGTIPPRYNHKYPDEAIILLKWMSYLWLEATKEIYNSGV